MSYPQRLMTTRGTFSLSSLYKIWLRYSLYITKQVWRRVGLLCPLPHKIYSTYCTYSTMISVSVCRAGKTTHAPRHLNHKWLNSQTQTWWSTWTSPVTVTSLVPPRLNQWQIAERGDAHKHNDLNLREPFQWGTFQRLVISDLNWAVSSV